MRMSGNCNRSFAGRAGTPLMESLEDRRLFSVSVIGNPILPIPGPLPPIVMPSPTVKGVGTTIHAFDGRSFTGVIGTLSGYPSGFQPDIVGIGGGQDVLQAVVNWGDHTASSNARFAAGPAAGELSIIGTHTYQLTGTFNITISVLWGPVGGIGETTTPVQLLTTINSKAIVVVPPAVPVTGPVPVLGPVVVSVASKLSTLE